MPLHFARADGFLEPEESNFKNISDEDLAAKGFLTTEEKADLIDDAIVLNTNENIEINNPPLEKAEGHTADNNIETTEQISEKKETEVLPVDTKDNSEKEPGETEEVIDDYVPDDQELIFSYDLQGYDAEDYFYAYNLDETIYLPISQLASAIGIDYTFKDNVIVAYFTNEIDKKYIIDLNNKTAENGDEIINISEKDYKNIDDTMFFSVDFLKRLFDIDTTIDFYSMEMSLDSEKEFPTNVKKNAEKRRKNRKFQIPDGSLQDYEMDNRLFGNPVFDFSVTKNWGHSKQTGKYSNSDSYTINFSGIAGGLDFNSYFSGNSAKNDRNPTIRLQGSRVFLDEPPNPINLKSLKVGDISGIGNSYFEKSGAGRGIYLSSFKDLVMSADKTIDIVGPLKEGWEVELYWNEMLIGYRQDGNDGEYNFPNIPVNYGLNKFKLVFYGPFGEVITEEKRYYSGASPVKKGEIGYTSSVYQAGRYLFENDDVPGQKNNAPVIDTNFYYGLSDDVTLMTGFTKTTEVDNRENSQNFAMVGAQYNMSGSSIQYNLERNLETGNIGHHIDWQGDVYLGSLYASYDDYNKIHSPISYYNNEYLKNKFEMRFSGRSIYGIPYSLSYKSGRKEFNGTAYEDLSLKASKQLSANSYLSLEENYSTVYKRSQIIPTFYYRMDKYSWQSDLEYVTKPHSEFTNFSTQLTWRDDKYTYYTLQYRRDLLQDMDYLTVSGARIFPFGGLSLSASVDKKSNFSMSLNYSNSMAKEPDKNSLLFSANSKLSATGTIYIAARDEEGNPVSGVGLRANNLVRKIYTNKEGTALLTDLMPYEKTILTIDIDEMEDLTLKPLFYERKIVLRPGTIRNIVLPFVHVGIVEGQIANPKNKRMYGYKIAAIDENGEERASVFSDLEGYFIMEDVPYGEYDLVVSKEGNILATLNNIKVDDFDISLDQEIDVIDYKVSNNGNDNELEENSEDDGLTENEEEISDETGEEDSEINNNAINVDDITKNTTELP